MVFIRILAVVSLIFGVFTFGYAIDKSGSAIHEIEGLLSFLIFTVCIAVSKLDDIKRALESNSKKSVAPSQNSNSES